MKKREFYFIIMGIGIGAVVSGIVFKMSPPPVAEYSDEKVIERAEELGMVGLKERIESNDTKKDESEPKAEKPEEISKSEEKTVETVKIEVFRGEGAGEIAEKLVSSEVIEKESDFRDYVNEKEAGKSFREGTYMIELGSDYETILSILTKGAY